jgi:hypothetical protein
METVVLRRGGLVETAVLRWGGLVESVVLRRGGLVEAAVGLAAIWRIARGLGSASGAAVARGLSREGSMVQAILVKI